MVIENHPRTGLRSPIFWALAFIVFLQFFTRYVLNDSLAWTEEIARYAPDRVVFIGAAMVTRRNTHIAVELLSNLLTPGPLRAVAARADRLSSSSASSGCWPTSRSPSSSACTMQRMTVFDLPMSYVYGGVALGCFDADSSGGQHLSATRATGWRTAHDVIDQAVAD